MVHDIFISYSQPDRHAAFAIHDALNSNGIKAWMASSITGGVIAGNSYKQDIVNAIAACRVFILVYSQYVNQSRDVKVELALAQRKIIIPILMDGSEMCPELKYDLKGIEAIDASQGGITYIMSRLFHCIPHHLKTATALPNLSTDKVLLRKGITAVNKKLYTEAKRIILQYIEIVPDDMEARYYFSLCLLNGKRPEKVDGLVIQAIEKQLTPFIYQPGAGHVRFLLALAKFGYYRMNGFREASPASEELIADACLSVKKASEIIYHVHDPANIIWRSIYQVAGSENL